MGIFTSKPAQTPEQTPEQTTPVTKDCNDYILVKPAPEKKTKSKAPKTNFTRTHTLGEKFIDMLAKEKKEHNIQRMHLNAFNAKNSNSEYATHNRIVKEPVKSGLASKAAMFHASKPRTEAERISAGVERRSTCKR